MKFLIPLVFILFFLSCTKSRKNDFDKKIKYAVDYGIDPATHDTVYIFAIPNGFSPNADGINDKFYAKGSGINRNTFEMRIYARDKNFIFYTNDINQGWDGVVQGRSRTCDMGVYTVDISLTDTLGNSHRYLNYLQLFR